MLSETHPFGRTARRRDVHSVGVTLDSGHCVLEGIYVGCIKKSRRAERGGLRTNNKQRAGGEPWQNAELPPLLRHPSSSLRSTLLYLLYFNSIPIRHHVT